MKENPVKFGATLPSFSRMNFTQLFEIAHIFVPYDKILKNEICLEITLLQYIPVFKSNFEWKRKHFELVSLRETFWISKNQ